MASPDNAADALDDIDGRTDKLSIQPSLSDSDDDIDLDASNEHFLGGLNVSNRLKNLLRFKELDSDDDDDEDSLPLFTTPSILKTPGALESLLPPKKPASPPPSSSSVPSITKKAPRKKKKAKAGAESLQAKDTAPTKDHFAELLARAMASASDSSDSENDRRLNRASKSVKKRTKKILESQDDGEPKTSTLLDSDSDSETERTKTKRKALSKKAMMEMHRENDRLRRTKEVKIQPRTKKKSLADLLKRIEEKSEKVSLTPPKRGPPPAPPVSEEIEKPLLTIERPAARKDSDSDSDIEIIGAPAKMRQLPLSPERAKIPAPMLSPTRPTGMTHGDLNRTLLGRISRDLLMRRRKLEDQARAQGRFTSAEERALRHLQREKEAEIIDLEVQRRLLEGRSRHDSDNESVPDEEEYLMQLSGQEEDEESEGEHSHDGQGDNEAVTTKDKDGNDQNDSDNEDEDDDDDENRPKLERRRFRSKRRTADDDDEEEEKKPSAPKKPEPAHSIANFFRTKDQAKDLDESAQGESENETKSKTLHRLTRRAQEPTTNEGEGDEQGEKVTSETEAPEGEEKEEEDDEESDEEMPAAESHEAHAAVDPKTGPTLVKQTRTKSAYIEAEAEEEEDEFFGMGGQDGEDDDDLDEYEQDGLLVDRNEDTDQVDDTELREKFNKQMAETDKNMIERLLKDITSGGLRRRRAAKEAGFMLDDYDIDDEEDDLVAMRRAASAKRRKLLEKSGNILHLLAQDPATAAFARAAQPMLDKSDDEEDTIQETETQAEQEPPVVDHDDDDMEEGKEEEEEEEGEGVASSSTARIGIAPPATIDDVMVEEDEDVSWTMNIQIQSKSTTTFTQPNRQTQKSIRRVERFKNLLAEGSTAFGGSNTASPRSGFGSAPVSKAPSTSTRRTHEENQEAAVEKNEPKRASKLRKILMSRTGSFQQIGDSQ